VIKSKKDSKHNKEHQGASTSAVIILSGKEPGKNMKPHETTDKENVVNSQPSHAPTLELKPKQVKVLPTPDTCTPPSKTQRTNTATEDASSPQSEQHRLEQRQKQIDYGYQTEGYKCYIQQVPKHQRTRGMPKTPEKNQKCSKRSFDGQIRKWRRQLHEWDVSPAGLSPMPDAVARDIGVQSPIPAAVRALAF